MLAMSLSASIRLILHTCKSTYMQVLRFLWPDVRSHGAMSAAIHLMEASSYYTSPRELILNSEEQMQTITDMEEEGDVDTQKR